LTTSSKQYTAKMDALRAEIANKRKALEAPSAVDAPPQKYMRKGDLQRLQQEREREEAAAAAQAALAASSAKKEELLRVSTPTLKVSSPCVVKFL
jgi:pre-mRNA-splicing factor 18